MLQDPLSQPLPTQVLPPLAGAGFVHDLDLVRDPPPQDTGHDSKEDQVDQPPSTEVKSKNEYICLIAKIKHI